MIIVVEELDHRRYPHCDRYYLAEGPCVRNVGVADTDAEKVKLAAEAQCRSKNEDEPSESEPLG